MTKELKAGPEGVDAVQYQGTYTVVNCTGHTITNVVVAHKCGDGANANQIVTERLAPGQATGSQVLRGQTGSNDNWDVTFEMNGQTLKRLGKQCNYEQSDSPETCVIALYAKNFTVLTPQSSPCLNNGY